MKHAAFPSRLAGSAIAALLASSSPMLWAQTVDAPVAPPTVAPSAAPAPVVPAAPVAASAAASAPGVKIVLPEVQTQNVSAPKSAASSNTRTASKPAPKSAREASPKDAALKTAQAKPDVPVAPVSPTVTAAPTVAPVSPPVVRPAPVVRETAPAQTAPAQSASSPDDNLMLFAGSAAAVLVGLFGAGALWLAFRRKRPEEFAYESEPAEVVTQPSPTVQPMQAPEPVAQMAVPASATAVPDSSPNADWNETKAILEQMVAQQPSPENPFLTRPKRLNRAMFLLKQQRKLAEERGERAMAHRSAEPVAEPQSEVTAHRTVAPVSPQQQSVYRFGPGAKARVDWKPRTN